MDTITEIQASPREFAAKYETMRAALEAVTAQLAAKDAELDELRLAVQRDILGRLDATAPQLAAVTAERDAARAEVRELRAAYDAAREYINAMPPRYVDEMSSIEREAFDKYQELMP